MAAIVCLDDRLLTSYPMPHAVRVSTGARLHFGPLAYLPQSGRHFGGIGLMISAPGCIVHLQRELSGLVVDHGGPAELEVLRLWRAAHPQLEYAPIRITSLSNMPRHQGLGSGTQRALAVGEGLCRLAGLSQVNIPALARSLGRGRRSAIGLLGYQLGGFIVDAGQSPPGSQGELAIRLEFPANWRILLCSPRNLSNSLSGDQELRKFEELTPMPESTSARLCRLVLTELLPAIQTVQLDPFNAALHEYSRLVGEFFRATQGGVFRSPVIERLAGWLTHQKFPGLAQSSWGPAAALTCASPEIADSLQKRIDMEWGDQVHTQIQAPLNTGRTICIE